MDSGLEAFLREYKNSPKPSKRSSPNKQFKYAENLANSIVSKREELEARSNLYNQGPMTVSGTNVPTQTTEGIKISRVVPTEHPGLQVMRAHALKRGFPGEWKRELEAKGRSKEKEPPSGPPPAEPPPPPPEEPEELPPGPPPAEPPPPLSDEEELLEDLGKALDKEQERDDEVISVGSDPQEARTEGEEAAEVVAAERQEGEYRRFDTDDEALPELPAEYRPGGALDVPYRHRKGKYQPTPAEEAKLSRWWKYRHFLHLGNPDLFSPRYTRPEFRKQAHEKRQQGRSTGALGGTFAGFNLNDMIYRGRLIDAGFSSQNATSAIRNRRKVLVRDYLPEWPPDTPLPEEFHPDLERQQNAAAARAAGKKKAKASPKSTARSSRG